MELQDFEDNVKRINMRDQAAYKQSNNIDRYYALQIKLEDEMDQMCNCNLHNHCESITDETVCILKAWDNWDEAIEDIRMTWK